MAAHQFQARFEAAEIDKIFAGIDQCHLPGAAVGIAIDGVPVYRKGFGLANMELPAPLTSAMRMRIGSTTKHFTALAYMLLCEEGLASLDDTIGKYVPGLRAATRDATIHQLMGHTSGIRDAMAVTMLTNGVNLPVTDAQMIEYYRSIDSRDFEPGTHWSYNNGGYILLTAAIEKITGEPFATVLRKRILEPAGLYDTMLRPWDSDFVPNSAALHVPGANGEWTRTYMGMEISGAGGMVSTMDDMLSWMKQMDHPVVGSSETWRLMHEPHRLANGKSTGYGLGLMIGTYRGVPTIHHAGMVFGGNSQFIRVPEANLDISIAVNRGDLWAPAYANMIIDVCVEGLDPAFTSASSEKALGTFVSQSGQRVVSLFSVGNMHLMSVDGGQAVPITPVAEDVMHLDPTMDFMQQSARIDGDAIVFSEFGMEETLSAIKPVMDVSLGGHAGSYRADTIDAIITVSEEAGGARATIQGRYGRTDYKLEPITPDIWRIEQCVRASLAATVRFNVDGSGLSLNYPSGMRHISFVRVD
ncbi:MAG: serine hydrolase domain-containing protein [Sphingomonadaceae bacterium]|jgi:CubicO group peptidase (beta-lactamase class C family)